jgi:hypothetical protein
MEALTTIEDVRKTETRGGNIRYVVRDADGNEYTTFRERIGDRAIELEGKRVRIEYHEGQRGQYTNVYLDKVEPAAEEPAPVHHTDTDPEEVAWRTAVEAAPWLVGDSDPHAKTGPQGALRHAEAVQGQGGRGHQEERGRGRAVGAAAPFRPNRA